MQETLLRAWQHPEVVEDTERSARAWLFTVARNMIIDERRSSRFRNEVATLDTAGTAERAAPDEVNTALDRLLIGDAMAELSAEHRAVIRRSYYLGSVDVPDRKGPRHRRGHRKVEVALRRAGAAAHTAGNGGDAMTESGGPATPFGGGVSSVGEDHEYALWDAAYVLGSSVDP